MQRKARLVGAVLIGLLLMFRTLFFPTVAERFDNVFLILLGVIAILAILPLERLSNLKIGEVAVTLDSPQVLGALHSRPDRVNDRHLQERLRAMGGDLELLPGARVLWIDDHPNSVLGERRLLRSLGVEVITAVSSEEAVGILTRDADFDLLVTDVQREGGTSCQRTGGIPLHEGTNFVVALRRGLIRQLGDLESIREIAVIFYAAYPKTRLMDFTRVARELPPEADATDNLEQLVLKIVQRLAEARRDPIRAPTLKEPTAVEYADTGTDLRDPKGAAEPLA